MIPAPGAITDLEVIDDGQLSDDAIDALAALLIALTDAESDSANGGQQ